MIFSCWADGAQMQISAISKPTPNTSTMYHAASKPPNPPSPNTPPPSCRSPPSSWTTAGPSSPGLRGCRLGGGSVLGRAGRGPRPATPALGIRGGSKGRRRRGRGGKGEETEGERRREGRGRGGKGEDTEGERRGEGKGWRKAHEATRICVNGGNRSLVKYCTGRCVW